MTVTSYICLLVHVLLLRRGQSENAGVAVIVHDPRNLPIVTTEAIHVRPNTEASISLDLTSITRAAHPYTTNCTSSWNRTSLRDLISVCPGIPRHLPKINHDECSRILTPCISQSCACPRAYTTSSWRGATAPHLSWLIIAMTKLSIRLQECPISCARILGRIRTAWRNCHLN